MIIKRRKKNESKKKKKIKTCKKTTCRNSNMFCLNRVFFLQWIGDYLTSNHVINKKTIWFSLNGKQNKERIIKALNIDFDLF